MPKKLVLLVLFACCLAVDGWEFCLDLLIQSFSSCQKNASPSLCFCKVCNICFQQWVTGFSELPVFMKSIYVILMGFKWLLVIEMLSVLFKLSTYQNKVLMKCSQFTEKLIISQRWVTDRADKTAPPSGLMLQFQNKSNCLKKKKRTDQAVN